MAKFCKTGFVARNWFYCVLPLYSHGTVCAVLTWVISACGVGGLKNEGFSAGLIAGTSSVVSLINADVTCPKDLFLCRLCLEMLHF